MNIYQVENSFFLMEGLDSEFLVVARSVEEAKDECLKLLKEDQAAHIETIKQNIINLEKSLNKNWGSDDDNSPAAQFMRKAQARSRENIDKYVNTLKSFNGYKRECLKVHQISPRLINGHIQYIGENEGMVKEITFD